MDSENDSQQLANPEPVNLTDTDSLIMWLGSLLVAVAGGSFLFATFLAPTRLSGATRSARLKWEQRQAEIDQVVHLGSGNSVADVKKP